MICIVMYLWVDYTCWFVVVVVGLRFLVRSYEADSQVYQGHVCRRINGTSRWWSSSDLKASTEQVQPHQHDIPICK